VDALAALVGTDEERARRARDHRPVQRVACGEPAGGERHPHPAHLVGDHVEVADHEPHDLHELGRHPQPLQSTDDRLRLRRRGEGEAGEHAQSALHDESAGGGQPGLADGQAEDLGPRAVRDERHQHCEDEERELHDHPLRQVGGGNPGDGHDTDQDAQVAGEEPVAVVRRRNHDEDEPEECQQLVVRLRPVDRRVAVVVQAVAVPGTHVSHGSQAWARAGVRRR
jgi:hypothetical protein